MLLNKIFLHTDSPTGVTFLGDATKQRTRTGQNMVKQKQILHVSIMMQ